MGVVYLALDTELNRRVAFKMIRTASNDPLGRTPSAPPREMVTRFLQEAWVTGGLEHPGIVPVYELGQTPSGVPYYTMRLVRGERTLDDVIREARTPEDRLALLEPFLSGEAHIRFVREHGGLERVGVPLLPQVGGGEPAQLVVHVGYERVEALLVARPGRLEDARDGGAPVGHPASPRANRASIPEV
jgi:hypothetical protein